MAHYFFYWDDDLISYLAEHDVTPDEFEQVVTSPLETGTSRSSGRPIAFGYTSEGRYLACVYEVVDVDTILPVTAFELEKD